MIGKTLLHGLLGYVQHHMEMSVVLPKNLKKNHKITKGLDNFVVNTEQYFMHTDPSVTILADTSFSSDTLTWINGVKMPVVWTKEWGKGRVFYSSLGHSLNDLKDENILKLTIQGIIWATR